MRENLPVLWAKLAVGGVDLVDRRTRRLGNRHGIHRN